LFAASGRVRFTAKDPIGGVIEDANVCLTDRDDNILRTQTTDKSGQVLFTDLPLGDVHFVVGATGFTLKYIRIPIRSSKELKIEATLEIGTVGQMIYSDKHPKYKGWLQY